MKATRTHQWTSLLLSGALVAGMMITPSLAAGGAELEFQYPSDVKAEDVTITVYEGVPADSGEDAVKALPEVEKNAEGDYLVNEPGTYSYWVRGDGYYNVCKIFNVTQKDLDAGYSHADNYVCTAQDYRLHMAEVFRRWHTHPEVVNGRWPATVEQCFGLAPRYAYPLCEDDALALADYFLDVYAPSRSPKNELRRFEGFVYDGPEYLTMFGGNGAELDTIDYPYPRVDDGLLWGDYAMPRIEPCNRVDRFNAGVAYLDGERPYLIACRGYYTRATLAAYDFFENRFHKVWGIDSGFVPMANPFNDSGCHLAVGTDPVYGILAGQGNHSISTADIDGDGCMEIVYGAAAIDHDGSLLYSKYGTLPDGHSYRTLYAHLDTLSVAVGDTVTQGQQLGTVGSTGKSTGNHLHLELRVNGARTNPLNYVPH